LTDETAKRNWEKYGNPDGPGAMSFGIALPSWIVDKENSVWVLGLYALVFMIALPTTVGIWWYRSIQYSSDKVVDPAFLVRICYRSQEPIEVLVNSKKFKTNTNPCYCLFTGSFEHNTAILLLLS